MNYTALDFLRATSFRGNLDAERTTYLAFLTQYDTYRIGPVKIAIKYMYAGKPISRSRFYIGHKFIIHIENLPDPEELLKRYNIPPPVDDRIFKTWYKYHHKTTRQLKHTIRKKLDLIPIEKQGDYLGVDIDDYLTAEGFKTIKKEI